MLQIPHIRSNDQAVIMGLKKKRFTNAEATISQVLGLDDKRRSVQSELDSILNELNSPLVELIKVV